jgi:hypothetical protein
MGSVAYQCLRCRRSARYVAHQTHGGPPVGRGGSRCVPSSGRGTLGLAGFSASAVEISTPRYLQSDSIELQTRVRLQRRDVKVRDGIPVTSVERTIIDLMAVCPEDQVEIALDDALTRRLTTVRRIMYRLDDLPRNLKGRRKLVAMLDERLTGGWPNSPLETITNRVFKRFPLSEAQDPVRNLPGPPTSQAGRLRLSGGGGLRRAGWGVAHAQETAPGGCSHAQ